MTLRVGLSGFDTTRLSGQHEVNLSRDHNSCHIVSFVDRLKTQLTVKLFSLIIVLMIYRFTQSL